MSGKGKGGRGKEQAAGDRAAAELREGRASNPTASPESVRCARATSRQGELCAHLVAAEPCRLMMPRRPAATLPSNAARDNNLNLSAASVQLAVRRTRIRAGLRRDDRLEGSVATRHKELRRRRATGRKRHSPRAPLGASTHSATTTPRPRRAALREVHCASAVPLGRAVRATRFRRRRRRAAARRRRSRTRARAGREASTGWERALRAATSCARGARSPPPATRPATRATTRGVRRPRSVFVRRHVRRRHHSRRRRGRRGRAATPATRRRRPTVRRRRRRPRDVLWRHQRRERRRAEPGRSQRSRAAISGGAPSSSRRQIARKSSRAPAMRS